jgi:hypothetical protein
VGILDHNKSWGWKLSADPKDCIQAFINAFLQGGTLLKKAKWEIESDDKSATATYLGRGGLIGGLTSLSQSASSEQDGAIGSTITFQIEEIEDDGTVSCAMWMSSSAGKFGFTADARFMRPYMQAVTGYLAALDPSVQTYRA